MEKDEFKVLKYFMKKGRGKQKTSVELADSIDVDKKKFSITLADLKGKNYISITLGGGKLDTYFLTQDGLMAYERHQLDNKYFRYAKIIVLLVILGIIISVVTNYAFSNMFQN